MTMRYTDYIWDFDGTLADTYPHTAAAFCEVLAQEGIEADLAEADRLLRISLGTAYKRYGVEQQLIDRFIAYEKTEAAQPPVRLYPHAREVLQALRDRGARHFIATHRDSAAVTFLQWFGIDDLFVEVVTRENGFAHKPDPACVQYLIDKYRLDPATTLMVGDRELDVACGKNAGTDSCLFVEQGDVPPTVADFCIRDLREILHSRG